MPERRRAKLPEILARVADRCGETAARRLALCYGGRQIYIPDPRRLSTAHPLVRTLGENTALALNELFGRGYLLVPMGPARRRRRVEIPPELLRGTSVAAVAKALGCHMRTVSRLRKRPLDGA